MRTFASVVVALALCLLSFSTVMASGPGITEDACEWDGRDYLECKSVKDFFGPPATGCVGLKNKGTHDVLFECSNKENNIVTRRLEAGKEQKADFQAEGSNYFIAAKNCVEGYWTEEGRKHRFIKRKVNCRDVFEITKNEVKGGGCGCKRFSCLPSTFQ